MLESLPVLAGFRQKGWVGGLVLLAACRFNYDPLAEQDDAAATDDAATDDAAIPDAALPPILTPPTALSATNVTNPVVVWSGSELGVVWEQSGGVPVKEIFFVRVDAATGAPIGAPTRVSDDDPSRSSQPALAWVGDGWGMVWQDERGGGPNSVRYAHVNENGVKDTLDIDLTPTAAGHHPDISWSGTEVGVSWADDRHGTRQVYMTRLNSDGTSIAPDIRVVDTGMNCDEPNIEWTGASWYVSYDDRRGVGQEVWASHVAANGTKLGPDSAVSMSLGVASDAKGRSDGAGKVATVWENIAGDRVDFIISEEGTGTIIVPQTELASGISNIDGADPGIVWVGDHFVASWGGSGGVIEGRAITEGVLGPTMPMTNASNASRPATVWTGRSLVLVWDDTLLPDTNDYIYIQQIAPF